MHGWDAPFFQVALPIILAQFFGFLWQNKRFDDMNKRFDDMNRRFDEMNRRFERVEDLLQIRDRDIAGLKERTGFVRVN